MYVLYILLYGMLCGRIQYYSVHKCRERILLYVPWRLNNGVTEADAMLQGRENGKKKEFGSHEVCGVLCVICVFAL